MIELDSLFLRFSWQFCAARAGGAHADFALTKWALIRQDFGNDGAYSMRSRFSFLASRKNRLAIRPMEWNLSGAWD